MAVYAEQNALKLVYKHLVIHKISRGSYPRTSSYKGGEGKDRARERRGKRKRARTGLGDGRGKEWEGKGREGRGKEGLV
jgi:hypothetical protein